MPRPTKKKILANVWKPLIVKLNEKAEEACLQRDAYLDRVFGHEAKMLGEEMKESNSREARVHLAEHLALLDRKQVNFALSPETVETMNDVCRRKNVPRDSFINRVLFFLVAKQPSLFEKLLGFDLDWYWTQRVLDSYMYQPPLVPYHLEGSLIVLKDLTLEDPFWAIRACIDAAREDAKKSDLEQSDPLLALLIPKDFLGNKVQSALGFNCRLPDNQIEGHPARLALEKMWDEVFGTLERKKPKEFDKEENLMEGADEQPANARHSESGGKK